MSPEAQASAPHGRTSRKTANPATASPMWRIVCNQDRYRWSRSDWAVVSGFSTASQMQKISMAPPRITKAVASPSSCLPPSWPERNSQSQKGDRVVWGSSPALSQHPPVLDTSDISGALTYLRSRSAKIFLIHRHRAEHGSEHYGRNQIG
jgi:hypothetical protein